MSYLSKDFLLTTTSAKKLYFDYARNLPIFDYHCHLPERQILENKPFTNIYDIWLSGDHYKWRLMRNYGVDENLITGSADKKEKFVAYCTTLGTAFGNPLYHWSQLELKEFFDCEIEINADNAEKIWEYCNAYILNNNVTPKSLIEGAKVKYIFTTNEVFDDLTVFEEIAKKDFNFKVIPAFRGDKIMNIDAPDYKAQLSKLEALTNRITCISDLEKSIELRLKEFIKVGATASDISVERVTKIPAEKEAEEVLLKAIGGDKITEAEADIFKGYLTYFLMKLYAKYDIRTELHIGAKRNNNTKMLNTLGADTGYDSISEYNSLNCLSALFNRLEAEDSLPATIIFNLNPKMNTEIMTLLGCFQSSEVRGKIQYGPAWWFLDNKVYMEKHLKDLTSLGHIGTFIGMLTDSRSFLSYPRHSYFRRILCEFLGGMMERGEITNDFERVGRVAADVSYHNAVSYFKMDK